MNIFAPKTRFGAACCALSLLVSFVVGCTPKENPEPKPDPKPQDVAVTDVTLSVEVTDIIRLLRWLHGNKVTLTDPIAADMDQNGVIDIFDLGLLKRALLGK